MLKIESKGTEEISRVRDMRANFSVELDNKWKDTFDISFRYREFADHCEIYFCEMDDDNYGFSFNKGDNLSEMMEEELRLVITNYFQPFGYSWDNIVKTTKEISDNIIGMLIDENIITDI